MGRSLPLAILAIVLVFSCKSNDRDGGESRLEKAPLPAVQAGAESELEGTAPAPPEPPSSGRARVSTPASEFHLDDGEIAYRPRPRRAPAREERATIHITLKSTPSGAMAAVDGVPVGRTPAFWDGEVTGQPHEFTFVLPGYAMARYRFVPTTHGIVHGTLKRLSTEAGDAGLSPQVEPGHDVPRP
jgi:hypothetical protein